jgi:hypothetical protein
MVFATANTVASTVTTTVRVVGSIHNNSAHRWAESHVALTAGFADLHVLVLFVANTPILAMHSTFIMRTSPLGRRTCA